MWFVIQMFSCVFKSDAFRLVSLSYVVNMGLIDKLYGCFLSIQGPIDECPKMAAFLEQATAFLHGMCKLSFGMTGRWVVSNVTLLNLSPISSFIWHDPPVHLQKNMV